MVLYFKDARVGWMPYAQRNPHRMSTLSEAHLNCVLAPVIVWHEISPQREVGRASGMRISAFRKRSEQIIHAAFSFNLLGRWLLPGPRKSANVGPPQAK
jgi:hypothetical protein